ncbi:Mitochondrial cation transporter [Aspergillus sclerotialis]|uniref:Mitochondrial cation transporter n=1 Tax=Aspergillus sclerotialis TaxID=2070753 RepID=A0A3A2ZF32_9EURO|nr:Mitochondrial cation transporter [Aspergillus sclerotialis]
MSASLPGSRDLPPSQYDLSTYWGRVRHAADIADPRTLFVSPSGLEDAKRLVSSYRQSLVPTMTPELWRAKKVVDSTLHPDTGEPVFLPFRMSCFIFSNLVVTAGMLTPGLKVRDDDPACEEPVSDEKDNRDSSLANWQPISQCSHQQRQCQ